MRSGTDYSQAALNLADGIVRNCLPAWFPTVGLILYMAHLGFSLTCRAARIVADLTAAGQS